VNKDHRSGKPVRGWAVWYGDGSVVRGRRLRSLDAARSDDVQAVVWYHPRGYRTILMGEDSYRVRGSKWRGVGKWMPTFDYDALIERAMEE
jgi:hypothetical protein